MTTHKAQNIEVKSIVFIEILFKFFLSSILGRIGKTIAKLDKEPN
nr:hypothetical protein CPBEC1_21940 [Clostridium perfringens]